MGLWQPAEAIVEEARQIGYKRNRLDAAMEPAKCVYMSLGFREILSYQRMPIKSVVFVELAL